MYNPTVLILVLCPLFTAIDGCTRRSVAAPATEAPAIATEPPSHLMACSKDEILEAACVPGNGECNAVELQGERRAFCSCFDSWIGTRCQEQEIPFDWMESRSSDNIRTANIAVGVSIAIVVVIIALIAIAIYYRKVKKRRSECPPRAIIIDTNIIDKNENLLCQTEQVPDEERRDCSNGNQLRQPLNAPNHDCVEGQTKDCIINAEPNV